jgi:hypothetical protein
MVGCATVLSVFIFTLSPFANCEIKAISLTLEVLQSSPAILDVVSLSQLNDIVLQGMFSDRDQSGASNHKKGNFISPNFDYCMISLGHHKIFETSVNFVSKIAGNCGVCMYDVSVFPPDIVYYSMFQYYNLRSFSILNDCLSEWLVTALLPRGYTDPMLIVHSYICGA